MIANTTLFVMLVGATSAGALPMQSAAGALPMRSARYGRSPPHYVPTQVPTPGLFNGGRIATPVAPTTQPVIPSPPLFPGSAAVPRK